MKKAIVFGSNGYLGGNFTHLLKKNSFDVLCSDINDKPVIPCLNYKKINIKRAIELKNINWNVDYIFIFSGLTGTYVSFENFQDFVETNEIGLLNILDIIKSLKNPPLVVFPSTRLVYKGIQNKNLKEDSKIDPKTIYAVNKVACENYLKIYHNVFGIPFNIFRICVPYGNLIDNELSYGTISHFLSRARQGKPVLIFGDGKQLRTFTFIEDIFYQVLGVIETKKFSNDTYNIGGETLSILKAADLIATKYKVKIEFKEWDKRDSLIESGDTIFSSKKIFHSIKYTYKMSFSEWIKKLNN
jgi:UDP-glucose 4-epimerase